MYIALKNTEHKGVYKKENFKKEWRVKGASIRSFKEDELQTALNWAGVKALSIPNSSEAKTNNNNNSNDMLATMTKNQNPVVNIIKKLKKRGAEGACISTRNLGNIILKLNPVYTLCTTGNYHSKFQDIFKNSNIYDFLENFEEALENDTYFRKCSQREKYNILEVPYTSQIKPVNETFLELTNIWSKNTLNSIGWETYNIDSLFEFECKNKYHLDTPELYEFTDEYFLNINDIVGIKEIWFSDTGNSYLIPGKERFNYSITMKKNEYNQLIQLLNSYEIEDVSTYTYDEH